MEYIDMRRSDSVADTIRFHLDTMQVMLAAGRNEYAQTQLDSAYAALKQIPPAKFETSAKAERDNKETAR